MNNSSLSPEDNNNNVICEAVGCYLKASTKVSVRVGSERTIFLFLCENCKPKLCPQYKDYKESKMEATSD